MFPANSCNLSGADGLPLSGQLLLPVGYDAERDGRLPLVIWAYPREFASAAAAGQITDSPYRFNSISYWGPHFLVTQGYAVLANAAMPIVPPSPDVEPNDSFHRAAYPQRRGRHRFRGGSRYRRPEPGCRGRDTPMALL